LFYYRGINLDRNAIGLAEFGTMCMPFYSYSLSHDGGSLLSLVITTAAHELGHNFHMNHDDGKFYNGILLYQIY